MEQSRNKALLQKNAEQVLLGKKTNMLLVKDDVGLAKPTTRTLPPPDFSFGKPEILPERDTAAKRKLIGSYNLIQLQPVGFSIRTLN